MEESHVKRGRGRPRKIGLDGWRRVMLKEVEEDL